MSGGQSRWQDPRRNPPLGAAISARSAPLLLCLAAAFTPAACRQSAPAVQEPVRATIARLPTGVSLQPVAAPTILGSMPLSMRLSPDGRSVVVLLGGWREQGFQVVDRATGRITQTVTQPAAFVGLAFAPDGSALYVSGSTRDVVYVYAWRNGTAALADSIILATEPAQASRRSGQRYPAGMATSPDGRTLYVAENLADSVAVIDVATRRVRQRVATERYPYGVAVAPDGTVYATAWGGTTVSVFTPRANGASGANGTSGGGMLDEAGRIAAGRHPSALLLNADGSRLFVASGSTDRITVIDTRLRRPLLQLLDPPPAGPGEGSTPNALALSADGTRLFVAEADNNAIAVFDLSARTAGVASATGTDRLTGRIPTQWYPTAVIAAQDTLMLLSGKGPGTAPNPFGPGPLKPAEPDSRSYTLGQTTGTLSTVLLARATPAVLARMSDRVAMAQGWNMPRTPAAATMYPPFQHVIYVIKENRTYDQVLGDLPEGDGDPALVFFPRSVAPNHHALARRFGIFDRFFTNAEVSPDGHNWSTAAYATDYLEKTIPSNYSGRGRSYDYEGTNGGFDRAHIPLDDVSEPANGYIWDLATRAGISFRNYGEFVVRDSAQGHALYIGDKPALVAHTNPAYPGFDLSVLDQTRMDVWLAEFAGYVRSGTLPRLEIVRLPNDHTAGARVGSRTPRAFMADNDLALARMIEALSRSPYWKNTVVFVVEDDAQNGPDHVDSHRAPFLVISAYNRGGVLHRWTNTTDVVATIGEILHLGAMSQFDYYGRPLRDIWTATPNLTPYAALVPAVDLNERNTRQTPGASESARLDLTEEDRADENLFNRVLWKAIKGTSVPFPGTRRAGSVEALRQ